MWITFGHCGLPLVVIHKTVIGQPQDGYWSRDGAYYLDDLRKTEHMEGVVFGHKVGWQLHEDGGRRVFESG